MSKKKKFKQIKNHLDEEEEMEDIALLKAMAEATGERTDTNEFLKRLRKRIELLTNKNIPDDRDKK